MNANPNQQPAADAVARMMRMPVTPGRPYFAPVVQPSGAVGVGLTNTAGERKACATLVAQEEIRILGGTMDLSTSLATVTDSSGAYVFSNADVYLHQIFGKRALARPIDHWRPPFILGKGNTLICSVLNSGPENNGNLVFIGEPAKVPTESIDASKGRPYWLATSLGLPGSVATESVQVQTAADQVHDTLVWGGACDLTGVSMRITDDAGNAWMRALAPVWSVFAMASGQIITQFWNRPYLIPKGGVLTIDVYQSSSLEANGVITLLTTKLPA